MPSRCAKSARSLLLLALAAAAACAPRAPGPPLSPAAERGRYIYGDHCAACHHPTDPHRDGVQGPPIAGSARELLEARILYGRYPDGYQPKRTTATMPPAPFLKDDIPALTAFLAEVPVPQLR